MKGKQQALMAAGTSPPCSLFPHTMDRTWMHNNVLIAVPRGICNTKDSSESTQQPAEPAPGFSSDKGSLKKEKKKKRLARLHACPSLTTMSSYHNSEVKILKRQYSRRQKSLSELERNEVKGFMDLGFVFRKEELSVEIMNMIPGLQRLGMGEEEGMDQEGSREEEEECVETPYHSEAWLTSVDPKFALVELPLYSAAEMKEQLRSWAKEVASYVAQYNFVDKC